MVDHSRTEFALRPRAAEEWSRQNEPDLKETGIYVARRQLAARREPLNASTGRLNQQCARPDGVRDHEMGLAFGGPSHVASILGGYVMRQFDFAPLYRSTVGFDRLAQLLDSVAGYDVDGYPPYNIERLSDNEYRISMAVAGFHKDEFKIDVKESTLVVSGQKRPDDKER